MLTVDTLAEELLTDTLTAGGAGFTCTKILGTYTVYARLTDGEWVQTACTSLHDIQAATAQIRSLKERFPDLQIAYPQTVLSETESVTDGNQRTTVRKAEAVIDVPESFVQIHSGIALQQILHEKWQPQLDDLTARLEKRLKKHELRSAEMFDIRLPEPAAVFYVTADSAESLIWTIPYTGCGLYPLQWDGEICGMAITLAEALRGVFPAEQIRIQVKRDTPKKRCAVMLYSLED